MRRMLQRLTVSLGVLALILVLLPQEAAFAAPSKPTPAKLANGGDPEVVCSSFDSIGSQDFGLSVSLVAAPNPVGLGGTVSLEDMGATFRVHSDSEPAFLYEAQAPGDQMSVSLTEDLTIEQGKTPTITSLPVTFKGSVVIPQESGPLSSPGFSIELTASASSFKATELGTATVSSAKQLSIAVSVPDASAPLNLVQASCSETPEVLASVVVKQCALGEVPAKNSLGQAVCVKVTGKPDEIEELGTHVVMSAASLGVISKEALSGEPLQIVSQGELKPLLVFSTNGTLAGWSVTGELQGPFSNLDPRGDVSDNEISAQRLSWLPFVSAVVNGKHTGRSSEVDAGKAQALSDLVPHRLCYAPAGGGGGEFACSAKLSLSVPPWVAAGTYEATLDLVLTVY